MSRGVTLVRLIDDLRSACRVSLNAAHNRENREKQIKALQRKQEFFWDDFAWPHLRVDRFLDMQAGQRFYDLATVKNLAGEVTGDLDITRITKAEVRVSGIWEPLGWGIDREHYATWDSDLDSRSSPVRRVKITEDEQLEAWPIPDENFDPETLDGRLKLTGIRKLKPLVNDGDKADLDDRLLVLHCAAEFLAATGAKDAQFKLDQANALYLKLRAQLMPRRVHNMFVDNMDDQRKVGAPVIAVYRAPPAS